MENELSTHEKVNVLNLYLDNSKLYSKGDISKRIGYKSFRGMVYQFKRINKKCIENNWSGDFIIRLPLKWK